MERGQIRWVAFKPPDKKRPVLILTRQTLLPHLSEIVVAPLTRTLRSVPSHVRIGHDDGVPEWSDIKCDNLLSVQRTRLGALVCTLSDARMEEVDAAIRYALGMDD